MQAIVINLILILIEIWLFIKVRKNGLSIFRFYTIVQNLIALITSLIFIIAVILVDNNLNKIPIFITGLHFTATYGLFATMLIFSIFLSPISSPHNHSKLDGVKPWQVNLFWHFLCPALLLVSMFCFEGHFSLDSQWTFYAAIPSIIYWILYVIMTTQKRWEDPYHLSKIKSGRLKMLAIPQVAIATDFLLYYGLLFFTK